MVKIDSERLLLVASLLKPLKHQIMNLYVKDPQYHAIRQITENRGCGEASLLIVINSIMSYRLKTAGENYWLLFAEYFSRRDVQVDVSTIEDFLKWSGNTILLEQKLKRASRILNSNLATRLLEAPLAYCSSVAKLIEELSKILRTDRDSKTVVFAAKMYGYLCYVCGVQPDYSEIPIPLDYRTAVLSLTSCIATDCDKRLNNCVNELLKGQNARVVKDAWNLICKEVGIPCLLVDTFTWLVTGVLIKNYFNVYKSFNEIKRKYGIEIPAEMLECLVECAWRYVR